MKKGKLRGNLAFNVIMAVVLLIVFFGTVVSLIGYVSFTESLTREYVESAYHNAYTATTLLDGGKIDDDPWTWQTVRVPFKDLIPGNALKIKRFIFQIMDMPQDGRSGIVFRNFRFEPPKKD